ncbi:uncharacterized protein LTR77_002081 [Saxophila tyrrhenica]|uniref:Uncharacterized protein n=1 Tax=Saxophila tyrrhenica TaxID=1690608 RepID=A0AAV9PL12_9PEZI|nr:hypothetical protein LTR77_002081 [Saxophila tyrrhenica]
MAMRMLALLGRAKWTNAIPSERAFPLHGDEYQQLCKQGDVLRERIARQSPLVRAKEWRRKYSLDHTYMDVDEAELTGALPASETASDEDVCDRSMTFVLGADDASFGKSILMLWLSYGLAKKEGRAFFIDDTNWAYGQYDAFFAPASAPACVQPPRHYIVPCPHSAKHLVVSSATLPWTFGDSFEREFTQFRKHGAERSRRIYDLLRRGYEDLFILKGEDALYAASRLAKFKEDAHMHSGSVVGMHIRRGDLHPVEFQFSQDYIPIERYASASRSMLRNQLHASLPGSHRDGDDFHKFLEYVHSPLLLGSDDPEIFDSDELKDAAAPFVVQKAQERIQLATKATLDMAAPAESLRQPGSAYIKHIDENSGWEGGFYRSLFFGLGQSGNGKAASSTTASDDTKRMRELVGRAYLLDLAVLGESDGVVCAVSSASCRLLGVMMGWEAVVGGQWVNVDDGRVWSWDGRG